MAVLVQVFTAFVLLGLCWSADPCADIIYKKVEITGKHLNSAFSAIAASSAQECAEKCRDNATCKSFGFFSGVCCLYADRIYAGAAGLVSSGWTYYWALEAECPSTYTSFTDGTSSVCYTYYSEPKIWTEAQQLCQADEFSTYTFLGATDSVKEDVWDWLNGVSINRVEFIPGRPDNSNGNQHCLAYKNSPAGLDDRECNTPAGFLCEIPLKEQSQTVFLPDSPFQPSPVEIPLEPDAGVAVDRAPIGIDDK